MQPSFIEPPSGPGAVLGVVGGIVLPNVPVHLEPQKVTLLGSGVFAVGIS